ncbi:MAG: response regulator [Rhodoferax sp.]|nr:response regulator [Rhodoferax sp.]
MILHHTRPTPMPLRVLVVDDEPSIRTTVSMMLTLEGHQVQTAADGDDGLRLAAQQLPDVILTDLHMPRLDGLALLAAVRGNPALAHTRVILLTGESPAELAVRAGPQADAQLTKPFTRVQLLEALLPKSC